MQGTAADLIKLAMLAVQKALDDAGQGHAHGDAGARRTGASRCPRPRSTGSKAEVPRLMAGVAQLSVPLIAEVGVGPNWDEAH